MMNLRQIVGNFITTHDVFANNPIWFCRDVREGNNLVTYFSACVGKADKEQYEHQIKAEERGVSAEIVLGEDGYYVVVTIRYSFSLFVGNQKVPCLKQLIECSNRMRQALTTTLGFEKAQKMFNGTGFYFSGTPFALAAGAASVLKK